MTSSSAEASDISLHSRIAVRTVSVQDLRDALRKGFQDFSAKPSHVVFLCVIYPVVGLVLARLTIGMHLLPLLFPLAAGFALVGPFAAIGLYEMSRCREQGMEPTWKDALQIVRSRSFGSILVLGLGLVALFVAWLVAARAIYAATTGGAGADNLSDFLYTLFATPGGWALIIVGNAVGFVFAAVALALSVVSFPMLLDRDVSAAEAVRTSLAVVRANPRTMAIWGLIVAVALVLSCIPLFIGLAVVLPILGHATWHLYRSAVEPPPGIGRN